MSFIDRTGEININSQGLKMEIIKYINSLNIDVRFENGYISKNKTYYSFRRGFIKNVYHPIVCGVGYMGDGNYICGKTNNTTIHYKTWSAMLKRCYDEKYHQKYPTYKDCNVCEEWHNFQNFGKWFDENYYEIENEKMQLDKDILIKGNKIYSPETCIFVPRRINLLFTKNNEIRGNHPIGVYYTKNKRFESKLKKNGKKIHLCYASTPEEAFEVYKFEKEKYIKEVADEYKDKIPQRLYDAMYRYKVEIDD